MKWLSPSSDPSIRRLIRSRKSFGLCCLFVTVFFCSISLMMEMAKGVPMPMPMSTVQLSCCRSRSRIRCIYSISILNCHRPWHEADGRFRKRNEILVSFVRDGHSSVIAIQCIPNTYSRFPFAWMAARSYFRFYSARQSISTFSPDTRDGRFVRIRRFRVHGKWKCRALEDETEISINHRRAPMRFSLCQAPASGRLNVFYFRLRFSWPVFFGMLCHASLHLARTITAFRFVHARSALTIGHVQHKWAFSRLPAWTSRTRANEMNCG